MGWWGGLTALLLAQGGVQPTVFWMQRQFWMQVELSCGPIRTYFGFQSGDRSPVKNGGGLGKSGTPAALYWYAVSGIKMAMVKSIFGQLSEKTPWVEPALGSMVEPSILNLAIQQKMLENVQDYRTQVKVSRVERGVGVWIIHLEDGTQLKTKLVIGADACKLLCP